MIIIGILGLGILAGWVAGWLTGANKRSDWGQRILYGLAGSFVGGLLASLIAGDGLALRPSGIIGSIVGATVIFLIDGAVRSR